MKLPKLRRMSSGNYYYYLRQGGQQISIVGKTEAEVYAKYLAIKQGIVKTKKTPLKSTGSVTLKQLCTEYIDSRRGRLSASTIAGYEKITRTMFQGIMGKPLNTITHRMLDKAVDDECKRTGRRGAKISPKTIKNSYMFLRTVLKIYAPDLDTDVDLPEVKRIPSILPEPQDIIKAVIGTNVELPCLLAAWYSFSMSEIRGLTKSKSLQGDQIVIVETVVRVDGKDVRKPGSKEAGRARSARLHPYIKSLIDNVDGDIIVPDPPITITKRYKKILDAKGVSYVSFHKLRHLNVSIMSMLHVPKAVARLRGGYSNDSIMEAVYDHAFNSSIDQAADAVDEFMMGIVNQNCKLK